jgi:hypothetical protein
MTEGNTNRIVAMVNAAQSHLATFARESYAHYGRGIIRVVFPVVQPGTEAIVSAEMMYHDLDEMRSLIGNTEDGSTTLRMIETYEPDREAVVVATIDKGNPLAMTMRLDPPVLGRGPNTLQ